MIIYCEILRFSELENFSFKVKYGPGENSQDCDYLLWNPIKDTFLT